MLRFYYACELTFLTFFSLFAFAMFASMPTGVATTSSSLAFLAAIPLFIKFLSEHRFSSTETMGLILFCYLVVSFFCDQSTFKNGLVFLLEYRIFLVLPVFVGAIRVSCNSHRLVLGSVISGALVSLTISYGMWIGWVPADGDSMSRGNHIYHGFIMSVGYMLALIMARELQGFRRYLCLALAVLIGLNVLVVEDGRTGYLQIITATSVFVGLTFSWKKTILASLIFAGCLAFTWWISETLQTELSNTYMNLERAIDQGDVHSSVGHRLEFYRSAVEIVSDSPVFGVGVGSVADALWSHYAEGKMKVYTDNVHGEFFNMLLAGGVFGVGLFLGFLIAIVYDGTRARKMGNTALGDSLIGLASIVLVSAMFNSTIKDFGEKHVLIVVLSACLAALPRMFLRDWRPAK